MDYARTASCRTTEVIPLPGYGDRLRVQMDEEHYLNVSFPSDDAPEAPEEEAETEEEPEEEAAPEEASELPLAEGETLLSEDDPFLESDPPLTSLAAGEDEAPQP